MQPHARDRVYVNFLGDEGPTASDRPTAPRSTTGWSRLKRAYDPTNFFRLNQNIEP